MSLYSDRAIPSPTWLQHKNGEKRHSRRISSSFRCCISSSERVFRCPTSPSSHSSTRFLSFIHLIPSQKAGNALVTPSGLRLYMGRGDHLLSDGSPFLVVVCSSTTKKNVT
ncbi:hypothetical protein EVAR_3700_1 [Eumeta japonica]|uniref:Uncharacterized protein n=1 Tax=Eumeta variegata TaxID=151549 RepID=A0A4C1SU75_EUMVA|nr:hypothetical protein EVAR_3700_1 [Eumeta japonica]